MMLFHRLTPSALAVLLLSFTASPVVGGKGGKGSSGGDETDEPVCLNEPVAYASGKGSKGGKGSSRSEEPVFGGCVLSPNNEEVLPVLNMADFINSGQANALGIDRNSLFGLDNRAISKYNLTPAPSRYILDTFHRIPLL
jgi:hypothetical protein